MKYRFDTFQDEYHFTSSAFRRAEFIGHFDKLHMKNIAIIFNVDNVVGLER